MRTAIDTNVLSSLWSKEPLAQDIARRLGDAKTKGDLVVGASVYADLLAYPSLFFWRDRSREVDFVVDVGGRLDLFEAKWTELPSEEDAVNFNFVGNVVGKSRVSGGAVASRTPNAFSLPSGFRAVSVSDLG